MTVWRVPATSSAARAALIFAIAVPLLAGAGDNPSRDMNRIRIESMNAAERARLERNFTHFKELSESDREKYRTLDRQIREDDAAGGRLRNLMNEYVAWLATLSPYERETIQKESNLTARAQLVRRTQLDHERQRERPEGHPRFGSRSRDGGWHGLMGLPRLSPEDLNAVVAVIAEESRIPQPERDEIDALAPPQRHLRILSRAMELEGPEGRQRRNRWPDEELLGKLFSAITNKPQQELLGKITDVQRRRQMLGVRVAGALAAEWRAEFEKRTPSEDEMQKQFLELDPARRDELQLLSPEEQRQLLAFGVLSRESPELRELIGVIQRLMYRVERPLRSREPRRGPDGRPEPPPDDRRGPRPNGRRGPPDRAADGPGPDGRRPEGPGPEGRPPRDPEGRRFEDRPPMPPGGPDEK